MAACVSTACSRMIWRAPVSTSTREYPQPLSRRRKAAVSGTLDARDLSGLVALAGSLLAGNTRLSERLEKAAASLVPAKFDAELKAAAIRWRQTDMALRLDGTTLAVPMQLDRSRPERPRR